MYKQIRKTNKKVKLFFGVLFFRIIIEACFFYFVLPRYPQRYQLNIKAGNLICSLLFFAIVSLLIIKLMCAKKIRPSQIIVFLVYLISFIPSTILIQYCGYELKFAFLLGGFWIILIALTDHISKKKHKKIIRDVSRESIIGKSVSLPKNKSLCIVINKRRKREFKAIFIAITVIFFAYAVFLSYRYSGLRMYVSFDEVYAIRNSVQLTSTFENFFINIFASAVLPILLGFMFKKKTYWLLPILLVMTFLVYGMRGNKSFLLVILLSIVCVPLYKDDSVVNKLPLVIATALAVVLIVHFITGGVSAIDYLVDVGVRRTMFTPSEIGYSYYKFFQNNPPIWLSDDPLILRLGWRGPYNERPLAAVVGYAMYGTDGINNGLFGNAMGEFGNFGIVLFPLIMVVNLYFIDALSTDIENKTILPLLISIVVILPNASVTNLLWVYVSAYLVYILLYKCSGIAYPYTKKKKDLQHIHNLQ